VLAVIRAKLGLLVLMDTMGSRESREIAVLKVSTGLLELKVKRDNVELLVATAPTVITESRDRKVPKVRPVVLV